MIRERLAAWGRGGVSVRKLLTIGLQVDSDSARGRSRERRRAYLTKTLREEKRPLTSAPWPGATG